MAYKIEKYNQKIDPLDPKFDQPREIKKNRKLFEGWEYYKVPTDKNRKGYKTVGVYKGKYYEADQSSKEKKIYRVKFSAVFLLTALILVIACILPFNYNMVWYVGIAEMFTFVCMVYVLVSFIIYLTSEDKKTEYLYKTTSRNLIYSTTATTILSSIVTIMAAASILLSSGEFAIAELTGIALFSACAVGMNYLSNAEKGIKYNEAFSHDTLEKNLEQMNID